MKAKKKQVAPKSAKKTAAKVAKQETVKPIAAAKNEKRTPMDIPVGKLKHAPWNPREEISPASVAELTLSIQTGGLISRVTVIDATMKVDGKPIGKKGEFAIIDGNRRVVACLQAGMKKIPCDIVECTLQEAKMKTIIANLQRKDADPIMEAKNIEQLVKDGYTIEQIAAETGRTITWVWRRKQLINLSDGWLKKVAKLPGKFSIDCLEKISRYDKDLQEKVLKKQGAYDFNFDKIEWSRFSNSFQYEQKDLKFASFCTGDCVNCRNNSGAQPMLFDDPDAKNGLGKCLDAACYKRKSAEHFKAEKEKLEAKYGELEDVANSKDVFYSRTDTKTEKNTVPYIYNDWSGNKSIKWHAPVSAKKSSGSKDSAKEKAEKKQRQEWNKARKALADFFAPQGPNGKYDRHNVTDQARAAIDFYVLGPGIGDPADEYTLSEQELLRVIVIYEVLSDYDQFNEANDGIGEVCWGFFDQLRKDGTILFTGKEYKSWRDHLLRHLAIKCLSVHDHEVRLVFKYFGEFAEKALPPGTLNALEPAKAKKADKSFEEEVFGGLVAKREAKQPDSPSEADADIEKDLSRYVLFADKINECDRVHLNCWAVSPIVGETYLGINIQKRNEFDDKMSLREIVEKTVYPSILKKLVFKEVDEEKVAVLYYMKKINKSSGAAADKSRVDA